MLSGVSDRRGRRAVPRSGLGPAGRSAHRPRGANQADGSGDMGTSSGTAAFPNTALANPRPRASATARTSSGASMAPALTSIGTRSPVTGPLALGDAHGPVDVVADGRRSVRLLNFGVTAGHETRRLNRKPRLRVTSAPGPTTAQAGPDARLVALGTWVGGLELHRSPVDTGAGSQPHFRFRSPPAQSVVVAGIWPRKQIYDMRSVIVL